MRKQTILNEAWLEARSTKLEDGCRRWDRYIGPNGYGYTSYRGTPTPAHRLSFYSVNGFWPRVCRHKCDNRWCVEPDHLEDGSMLDNINDAIERGGIKLGQDSWCSRLTDEQFEELRTRARSGEVQKNLALEFGVSQSYVSYIKSGKTRRGNR